MKEHLTIKELSDIFSVSTRTIVRHLDSLILKKKNKVYIPLDIIELLKVRHNYDTTMTQENEIYAEELKNTKVEYDILEGFSKEEYQEFQKRLIEYPIIQKDLEYHRKSAESHQRQMELILRNLEQRNFIEAKDKNLNE